MRNHSRKSILNRKHILLFITLTAILLITCIDYGKVLIIKDIDHDLEQTFFLPDNTFTLGYIHSVQLTPVEEFFRAEQDNTLMLYKTIYESFGVGLPFTQEVGQFDMEDGKFVLKMERPFNSIKLRVSPIPEHWVSIGETRYELIDLVTEADGLIELSAVGRWVLKLGRKIHIVF